MKPFVQNKREIKGSLKNISKEYSIFIILIALVFLSALFIPNFWTTNNIINIIRQVSALSIIALGEYFVILVAGIDLSLGSTIGFVGVIIAGLVHFNDLNFILAIFIALIVSIVIGLVNGALVVYGEIQPFIATLATMIIIKGCNFLYSKGLPISGLPETFSFIGRGYIGVIPVPIIIMFIIAIISFMFVNHTATGRSIYAVGGNEEASKLSGINVKRIKVLVYVLASFFTAIGAIIIASRITVGQPTVGDPMLFDIITAVVLGGTSMAGGRGKVLGVIAGALILGVLANSMVLLRIGTYWQWIIRGVILVIAVLIDSKSKREGIQ